MAEMKLRKVRIDEIRELLDVREIPLLFHGQMIQEQVLLESIIVMVLDGVISKLKIMLKLLTRPFVM